MIAAELTVAQEEMKSRQSAEPTPIIVTVRRDGTRCWVQYPGDSPALGQYVALQGHVTYGTQHSEQCDSEGHFSEWDFTCVRAASRFARELNGFVAPSVDTVDNWAAALKRQFLDQLAGTWELEDEAMERIRKVSGEQA